jgi:hypothetical protein
MDTCIPILESVKNNTAIDTNVVDTKAPADSLSLVQRLRELTALKYDTSLTVVEGPMCYVMASPMKEDYVCPVCASTTPSTTYANGNIRSIRAKVEEIKKMGYDVVLDESGYCSHCSGKEVERPELVFKIRFSENAPYHTAKSNIYADYDATARFLKGSKDDIEVLLNARKDNEKVFAIIKKMTGLDY